MSDINMRMRGRGKEHYFCLNWTSSYILFTVLLNNFLFSASTLVPASKVQLLRGGESDEIEPGERIGWNSGGKPEETTFGLHLLETRLKRVKRSLSDEDRRYYIIVGCCLVGGFFICCCLPCALCRLREWWGEEVPQDTPPLGPSRTTRGGANPHSHVMAPLMPEKPSSAPTSDQNGPQLPPSYETAVLEDEKVAELDKRLDQQKEVIDAQNARLAEQEAKLAEMSRRLVENEQITAVADST